MFTLDESKNILSGKSEVSYGSAIQTAASYLRASKKASPMVEGNKSIKEQEAKRLEKYISENELWLADVNYYNYISNGSEQLVFIEEEKYVYKLNDAIYYESWIDYFNNLLLHNLFFPDTAYELKGFLHQNETLFAVIKQNFVLTTESIDLNLVKTFMKANGFKLIRNNDYYNEDLGIIIEDLHDENVLVSSGGLLRFIDTAIFIHKDKKHLYLNND